MAAQLTVCRFRIGVSLLVLNLMSVWLAWESTATLHPCLCSAASKSCSTQQRREEGEKKGPSVAADGDLWTGYKLQSLSKQRCPKYVTQIDQSGWEGEH